MCALFSYTPLYSSKRCCRYHNMTQHKFSIMCCYTLLKSVLFPDVLISRNYIPSIELLSQNLESHLKSFPHSSPSTSSHQILLIPLNLFSNCLLLSIPIATILSQSHYNLPPQPLPSKILPIPMEELNYNPSPSFPNSKIFQWLLISQKIKSKHGTLGLTDLSFISHHTPFCLLHFNYNKSILILSFSCTLSFVVFSIWNVLPSLANFYSSHKFCLENLPGPHPPKYSKPLTHQFSQFIKFIITLIFLFVFPARWYILENQSLAQNLA